MRAPSSLVLPSARVRATYALPLALSASILAGGCRSAAARDEVRGVTAARIKVGTYGPLSGPAAPWGVMLHAMEAYFADLNAKGGVHGRQVDLIVRDDRYSPSRTPTVVRELVEREGVFAVLGGIGTASGRSVATYLEDRGVPFFSPASGDAYFTTGDRSHIYTVYPRYETEGAILGRYLVEEMGLRRIGVLRQDDDFGAQGAKGLRAAVENRGGSIVVQATCLPSDTDLSGQAHRIRTANPEALVVFTGPRPAVLAVKALYAAGPKPQIVTSFVLSDPVMMELAGPEVWEGTLTSARLRLTEDDDPAMARYRAILKEQAGGRLKVGSFTLSGFSFAAPFAEALERAGPDLTVASFTKALHSMHDYTGAGPTIPGRGYSAPITFGPDRRLGTDQIYLARAENGRWVRVTDWLAPDPSGAAKEKRE